MGSKEIIFKIFKEFMAKVVKLEELTDEGSKLLAGFHQGLEFIRRPPIHKNSSSVEKILKANETNRLLAYVDAGCVKSHDKIESISNLHTFQVGLNDHLSKVKCTVEELEGLIQKATSEMLSSNETESRLENEATTVEFDADVITNDEEGMISCQSHTDYAAMMSIIFNMVKRDVDMQEKIISSLTIKSTSGELESYSLMWSLHPYINDEIMHQALRLIP